MSNIIISADVECLNELWKIFETMGSNVDIIKIHHDIITDFTVDLDLTIQKINKYKYDYNFLVWEDRKYADIGYIMEKQVKNHVSKWADIISVQPISGIESVMQLSFIKVILIGEMSSSNTLCNDEYKKCVIEMTDLLPNVIGIVCQSKMTETKLNIVPGISLKNKKDGKGQCYNTMKDRSFADYYVVGRSILNSENPQDTLTTYMKEYEEVHKSNLGNSRSKLLELLK